jgi:hypothetical protein
MVPDLLGNDVSMRILALVLALLAGVSQRAPELRLNLVAAPPPPERASNVKGIGSGCAEATSHRPPATFKVTLADTDRLAYQVGDRASYNVILENTSSAPIVLGISRDPEVAPKTMSPCRVVHPAIRFGVALVAMTKTGPGATISSSVGFYGSPDVPGTTLALEPGERVRVQLPAQIWPGPGMAPVLTTDPQPVRIKAFVMIERDSMLAEYSENTLEIELSHRFQ